MKKQIMTKQSSLSIGKISLFSASKFILILILYEN